MMTKKNQLQRKLAIKIKQLQAIRDQYPEYNTRSRDKRERRAEYLKKAKPIRLKINSLKYYIKLEEKKTNKLLHIAATVCDLSDIETLWQKGRSRDRSITMARHIFVVVARQKGHGTWIVQWYLNKNATSVCSIPAAYKLGWRRVRKDPAYRDAYNRVIFALEKS